MSFHTVPDCFLPTAETKLTYHVVGSHELARPQEFQAFIVPGLAVRAVNMFFALQQSRESWLTTDDIYGDFFAHLPDPQVYFHRAKKILNKLRELSDLETSFIERSRHAESKKVQYRIHPDIGFVDNRDPDYCIGLDA